jgi:glucose-1-phosphate adenylyltransferase
MGIYVFNQQVLAKSLENDKPDFGKHIIPESISQRRVFAYIFNDYWEDIGTVRSFFEVHMDLTKPNPPFNFFDNRMPIHTNRRNLPASKIADSRIERVLLSPGCMINASEIVQSVIGVRAQVGAQSKLRQVVVMGADYYEDERQLRANDSIGIPHVGIGRNCSIEMTIIDKNARIGDGVKISPAGKPANLDHPLYCVRDGIAIIPKNSIIPAGTTI